MTKDLKALLESLVGKELESSIIPDSRQQEVIDEAITVYSRDKFYKNNLSVQRPNMLEKLVRQAITNVQHKMRAEAQQPIAQPKSLNSVDTFVNSTHIILCNSFEEYSTKYSQIVQHVLPNKNLKLVYAHRLKGQKSEGVQEEFNFSIKNISSGAFRFIKLRLTCKIPVPEEEEAR